MERGNHNQLLDSLLVGRSGFEPLIFGVKGRCPGPLDERPALCNSITLPLLSDVLGVEREMTGYSTPGASTLLGFVNYP